MTERHNWGPQQWAEYIIAAHGRTVASIVETGKRWSEYREVIHADKQIGWGDKVFDLTGYGKRSANRHILIHEKLSPIGTRFSELPSSWRALSELALLDTDKIEAVLDAGLVTRSSTRKDIVIAVKVAKEILPQDFRIAFGGEYYEDLQDSVLDYRVMTDAVKGETDISGKTRKAPPEKPETDPRVRTIRDMQRKYLEWVDNTEEPFEEPSARRMAKDFVIELGRRLGLTVLDSAQQNRRNGG